MENYSKLKQPIGWIIPIVIFFFLFFAMIEIQQIGTMGYVVWGFGAFFIVLGIADYYRTGLTTLFVLGLLLGTGTWHSLMAFNRIRFFSSGTYLIHLIAVIVFTIFRLPILKDYNRLKANARRSVQIGG